MSDFVGLERLLLANRDGQALQAVRGDERITRAQWLGRVSRWYAFLRTLEGRTWALHHSDAAEFSAILFALWACDKVACVPGSNQPRVMGHLAPRVDGFLGEFDDVSCRTEPGEADAAELPPAALDPSRRVLEVFTSGSSGEPKAIPKHLSQLSAEVNNLEALWGEHVQGAVTMATVSHHHIYGLLFRVLWPLAAGRCFDARQCEYFQQISHRGRGWERVVVASSPAHLSRLPLETDCEVLLNRCSAVFSSGAPLHRDASLRVRKLLGFAPIEVYGSSETGGIAWRTQPPGEEALWQPMPEVEVSLDENSGCLRVRSPYLPPMPAGVWYVTADKAELYPNGCFRLHGRVDRIVKIEGKRVSLDEMEQRLHEHPAVQAARLVLISGRRTELGAVLVLTAEGRQRLRDNGRRPFRIGLQKHLHEQFERTVIPRRWRYVDAMPVNSQGKTTQRVLQALFADGRQPDSDLADVVNH